MCLDFKTNKLIRIPIRKINYLYNATGQKVAKKVTNNSTETMTDYLNGFHYENQTLKFFATAEGYVNTNISSGNHIRQAFSYVYNYTDHLGNIRLSYTASRGINNSPVILEENHYYPFGLKHTNYGFVPQQELAYAKKFNHREWQDEHNLNVYAMDMRQYDPAIARWVVHDPVIHHSMSPYNAFDNNPVFWADPSGGNSIYGLANLFSWENRLQYNWDSGTYSFFGEEVSHGLAMLVLNTFDITREGGGGTSGDLKSQLDANGPTVNGVPFSQQVPVRGPKSIYTVIKYSPELQRLQKQANYPFFLTNRKYGDNVFDKGETSLNGRMIWIFKKAFESNLTLAYVVGHELNHSWHLSTSIHGDWMKQHGIRAQMGLYVSEVHAYAWEIRWGNNGAWSNFNDFLGFLHNNRNNPIHNYDNPYNLR